MHDGLRPLVLVTGSRGLIGTALSGALRLAGFAVHGLDLRGAGPEQGDIRVRDHLERAIEGCVGVVHLAAVSRVIDGERDPAACWDTNVGGTQNVLDAATGRSARPWLVYASSREVYGQPSRLPVSEDAARVPVNIYGRSKVEAEDRVRGADLHAAIVRFSNVYGRIGDHPDRVVPAFARRAAVGGPLRVDGAGHTFDFTHLDDTVRGVLAVIEQLQHGEELSPLHFVTGTPTTLGDLARLAVDLAGTGAPIHEAPPRSFDVSDFCGDPARAAQVLDWRARVGLRDGLAQLIADFRAELRLEAT